MTMNKKEKDQKHIVLLGASIGMQWNLPSLPERIDNFEYYFEYIGSGQFDKSNILKKIIERKEKKPVAVFIKQCAAYFPNDFNRYKGLMRQWIKKCQEKNVIPIPTTIVPVTRLHSFKMVLINIAKRRNPFQYGNPFCHRRNTAILEYNDWIRTYCGKIGIKYLDLEASVRYSEKNRYLREDLAHVDGLHINTRAYRLLDLIVIPTLETIEW